jgi:DNA modification methylase
VSAEVIHGDCLDVMPTLAHDSVDAVVTSPPYAMQRKKQYGGIPEADYPAWTVAWLAALRPALKERGSVLLNIREHVKDGQISDYVHHTRLAVRAAGWIECDELIWVKPSSAPVGHVGRPRRSWERVLWFSPSTRPTCFPTANGRPSKRIGIDQRLCGAANQWLSTGPRVVTRHGVSRSADYVAVSVGVETKSVAHPAKMPTALARWLLRLVAPPDGLVLDPFTGSGTTGIAATLEGRRFLGIEREAEYVEIARARIAHAQPALGVA